MCNYQIQSVISCSGVYFSRCKGIGELTQEDCVCSFSDVAKVIRWTWLRTSLQLWDISLCASSIVASMNH